MVKQFHGKYYYIECNTANIANKIMSMINTTPELDDEKFRVVYDTVIVSNAKCGTFRGIKYAAWEKIKRYAYKLNLNRV